MMTDDNRLSVRVEICMFSQRSAIR